MLHENLRCYQKAVSLAEGLSKEGARWPYYLLDQQRRAMASVVEVAACVDLSKAFGLIREEKASTLKSKLSEISKMIWGLIR
jgi:four helix bundle protein